MGGELARGPEGAWAMQPEASAAALAELRERDPKAEIGLHTRAFEYYLGRLRAAGHTPAGHDDACLYHLDRLFILVGGQMDWGTIAGYTADVRAARPLQARHVQRLDLYEGYSAIRMLRYAEGESLLGPLGDSFSADPDVRIKALKGLADAAYMRSQYERALELYERLLGVAAAAGDDVYQGLALLNMGLVSHDLDRNEEAMSFCERSLALFQQAGDQQREAHARYHTALYSMHLGRWQAAAEHADAVAPLFERLGLDSYLGFVYWLRGYLSHMLGEEAASEAAYQRALPLAESPRFGQQTLAMDVWLQLGFLYQTQERTPEALECYAHALAAAGRLERPHTACVIHFRVGQTLQHAGRAHEALSAYLTAIEHVEQLRGAISNEDMKIKLLGTTQQIYEAVVLLLLELGRPEDGLAYVERARSRAFLDMLAQRSPELYQAFDEPVAALAEIQARLPEGALLLEYYTTGVLPRGEHVLSRVPPGQTRLRRHLAQPPRTIVFAIGRGLFHCHTLEIDPNRLRPMVGDRYPGRHLLFGGLPQALYERLIAPLAEVIAGHAVLYLVPHGPLHYVPFGALCDATGEPLVRANGPAIASAPSATILCRSCLAQRSHAGADEMLAIGYNDPGGERPLQYAEVEARHVARMAGGQAWVGPQPKSEALLQAAPQLRQLHIAGHARFDPESPLDSALLLGEDDELTAHAILARLELRASVVTLSSCLSGVSHVVPGDELLGLQRALLFAGTPTIVCTRWEATDLVALLVMDHFYAAMRAGHAPAAALCQAQLAVREMTVADLLASSRRWTAAGGPLAEIQARLGETLAGVRAMIAPGEGQAGGAPISELRPFADPLLWAPFMIVGRA
jgi:CHAT domain-containing protein/tetratricopeptide (TPR) repeat protein